MSDEFIPLAGLIVPSEALELRRSRELAQLIGGGTIPFVRLVECRRDSGGETGSATETVVVDVDVERPQSPLYDIRRCERIATVFHAVDRRCPEALALRHDFPRVPHLNHTPQREFPRSLCLYDQAWPEIAIRWTPLTFIERIRSWLRLTAKGILHQEDQPLEQLLFGTGLRIILPTELLEDLKADDHIRLDVFRHDDHSSLRNLVALRPTSENENRGGLNYVAIAISANPQTHGIIRSSPTNLAELHDFLLVGGIDLIAELRRRLGGWEQPKLRAAHLVLIIAFPLRRTDTHEAERWEFWAFLTIKSVQEIGVAIGLWGIVDNQVARFLNPDDTKRGQDVCIDVISPYMEFSRTSAASANGIEADPRKVVAVGAGALGSQVVATLARSGFGTWTIVDEDDLLPHNLARHVLPGEAVGLSKANSMAVYLDRLYSEKVESIGIVADVLYPGEKSDALKAAYSTADLILDIAASVPVARHLALDVQSPARRVSVFLNPQGTDIVVLAEDKSRTLALDVLETQYYQAAANLPDLAGHLASNAARLRYGRSCRDVTTAIPTHLVSMHAAIASQAVRRALAIDDASIRVWRCDTENLGVTSVEVAVTGSIRRELSGWTLVINDGLRSRLASLRLTKLPHETGGVLIGVYDLTRRVVYVADTVPSPPDSAEWPTLYIRGCQGLPEKVRELGYGSGGQLEYVGEWHSHPDDCSTLPSNDDLQVFTWLTTHMADAGLPALMAIIGERSSSTWFLGEIAPHAGWRFEC